MLKKINLSILLFIFIMILSSCGKNAGEDMPYPMQMESIRMKAYSAEEDKEFARNLSSRIGKLHDEVAQKLGIRFDEQVIFVIHSDIDEFKAALGSDYEEGMLSMYSKGTVHMLSDSAVDEIKEMEHYSAETTGAYEYVGIMLESINKKIPMYLKSGTACYLLAMKPPIENIQLTVTESDIPTIEDMKKVKSANDERLAGSYIFVDFVVREYGYDVLAEFIKKPNAKKVFGKNEDELYAEWVTYSKDAYTKDFERNRETAHFSFNYMSVDDNAVSELSYSLERNFNRITSALGVTFPEKIKVNVYPDFESFNMATLQPESIDTPIGSSYKGEFCVISPYMAESNKAAHRSSRTVSITREILIQSGVHEFTHTAIYEINENVPDYIHEGASTYFAGQTEYYGTPEILIPYLLNQNAFPSMETIKIFTSETNSDIYVIGYAFAEYVVEVYGEEAFAKLVRTPDDFEGVFGKTDSVFYDEWLQWLTNKYCK